MVNYKTKIQGIRLEKNLKVVKCDCGKLFAIEQEIIECNCPYCRQRFN